MISTYQCAECGLWFVVGMTGYVPPLEENGVIFRGAGHLVCRECGTMHLSEHGDRVRCGEDAGTPSVERVWVQGGPVRQPVTSEIWQECAAYQRRRMERLAASNSGPASNRTPKRDSCAVAIWSIVVLSVLAPVWLLIAWWEDNAPATRRRREVQDREAEERLKATHARLRSNGWRVAIEEAFYAPCRTVTLPECDHLSCQHCGAVGALVAEWGVYDEAMKTVENGLRCPSCRKEALYVTDCILTG